MARHLERESVFRSVYNHHLYGSVRDTTNCIASAKDSLDYVQRLGLLHRLRVHTGCVNTVHWNKNGEYLLSGSDDQCFAVTNPHTLKVLLKHKSAHKANIFSARFLPQSCDKQIVSCSGDGIVLHTDLTSRKFSDQSLGSALNGTSIIPTSHLDETGVGLFNCHKSGTTYDVLTMPLEPRSFLSCGEDGTVRLFDLRQISSCHKTCCKDNILIFSPASANAMDVGPISQNYLAVGSSDSVVRIYDRRYLSIIDFSDSSVPTKDRHTRPVKAYVIPSPTKRRYRITSVKYSPEETQLLVNYSCEYLYLFDLQKDGLNIDELHSKYAPEISSPSSPLNTEQATRRLRLRGDWSDTGPEARPDHDPAPHMESGQVRPQLQSHLMSRMTEVIARMLNDPRTRLGLMLQSSQLAARETQPTTEEQNRPQNPNPEVPSTSNAWRNIVARRLQRRRQESTNEAAATSSSNERTEPTQAMMTEDAEDRQTAALQEELAELGMDAKPSGDIGSEEIDQIYDFINMKFVGHRNARTLIKEANFWGHCYVMSGSDCGHIFIWNRYTGKLVMTMQADQHVVNCVQPHPQLPYLASSGIDYDVKIWAPILETNGFNEVEATNLQKRNAVMLEQTKDTITVPAAFMIRMLACIRSLRDRDRAGTDDNSTSASTNNNAESSDDSSPQEDANPNQRDLSD